VFDALTSRRPYKDPYSFEETIQMLEAGRGTHFDPDILDAFTEIVRPLHEEFADRTDDHPRDELQTILDRYFERDVVGLLDS
jgi:HD-GYP domain-containing protein (c-di-GMP phosphodiesterase class II)